jgi:Ser/Thr protein kinase RdoA (MazF antagonist)
MLQATWRGVLPESLPERLRDLLGFELVGAVPVEPGVVHNNRLFRLQGAGGRALIAKLYYRDDRNRLAREYGAFRFLRRRGLTCVPVPYLADETEQYAVYSFEPGHTKTAATLTLAEMAAIGRLAAALHRYRPGEPDAALPPAFAEASLAGRIDYLQRRLAALLRAAAAPDAYPALRALVAEVDLPAAVERLISAATAGLSPAEIELPAPAAHRRLNPGDFAPHNILVRPDGTLCALDFEYACWDAAAALPASFVAAEQSASLTAAQVDAFLGAYRDSCAVPPDALARFEPLRLLLEAGQLLTSFSLMTPAHVARKRFAGDFDLDMHLAERRRLVDVRVSRAAVLAGATARRADQRP